MTMKTKKTGMSLVSIVLLAVAILCAPFDGMSLFLTLQYSLNCRWLQVIIRTSGPRKKPGAPEINGSV